MVYQCNKCQKEFPLPAWSEGAMPTGTHDMWNVKIKKACCPFCHSIDISEPRPWLVEREQLSRGTEQ